MWILGMILNYNTMNAVTKNIIEWKFETSAEL